MAWVILVNQVFTDWCVCLSLTCREGAIDRLVGIYKDVVHKTGVSTVFLNLSDLNEVCRFGCFLCADPVLSVCVVCVCPYAGLGH